MKVTDRISFDNTLSVRLFAQSKEAQSILYIPDGNMKQLFKVGDKVTSTDKCCMNMNSYDVTIDRVDEEFGYYNYVVKIERLKYGCKKKKEIIYDRFRQMDLKLI